MDRAYLLAPLAFWVASAVQAPAFAVCQLRKVAEVPVTMRDGAPTIPARINGSETYFVLDSGAFYSVISPAQAAQLQLKLSMLPRRKMLGIGGAADIQLAVIDDFKLDTHRVPGANFIVGGSSVGAGATGVIGQNILSNYDVEYDLGNGNFKLVVPEGCRDSVLAYWATSTPYSVMPIESVSNQLHTTGHIYVNGIKLRATFDTGAAMSLLDLRAAERAGIKQHAPGVVSGGYVVGFGPDAVQTWLAPVGSFKVGDEEIRNTRLRVGPLTKLDTDMLLGADFFLSHRIYVSNKQRKLYFTYSGGPVFRLDSQANGATTVAALEHAAVAAEDAGAGIDTAAGAAGAKEAQPQATAEDAAALARRGAASAARHDFPHALADLNRACELKPGEPEYFYQRAEAYLGERDADHAAVDFDRAIKLKSDYVPALIARASLRRGTPDEAIADLDAVDRATAAQGDVRLELAHLYESMNVLGPAIAQYGQWISAHSVDARVPGALASRCWDQALLGEDLNKGLADCNLSLRRTARSVRSLHGRALIRLKQGDPGGAITDYNAVLKAEPHAYWALYGRGIAELHKGMQPAGEADIAAAVALHPAIAEEAKQRGLIP